MRRLPELWFKYNILTESTRLPFSVAEHAAFSLPRVILASRCIKFEGGAMSTVNEYLRMREIAFGGPPGLGPKSSESAF